MVQVGGISRWIPERLLLTWPRPAIRGGVMAVVFSRVTPSPFMKPCRHSK